jgi:hypothetical protein
MAPEGRCRLALGGARDSGFGREHGQSAIENFTEPKAVWINTGPDASVEVTTRSSLLPVTVMLGFIAD